MIERENTMTNEMSFAIMKMVKVMKNDYLRFWKSSDTLSPYAEKQLDGFVDSIEISEGNKYIKIIRNDGQRMVWGFIVNTDNDAKFKRGDILKAAGWAAPARNKPRGNILDGDFSWVRWTGPEYL